jgi:hypothetical protein
VLVKRQGFAGSSVDFLYDPFGGVSVSTFEQADSPFIQFPSAATSTFTPRHVDPIRGGVWWRTLVFEAVITALAVWRAGRLVHVPRARLFRRPPQELADAA